MKILLIALLALTIYAQDPNNPDTSNSNSPDASDSNNPDASNANNPDTTSSGNEQNKIDIEGIKCLCNLQLGIGVNSTDQGGPKDCGLGDPAPKLSIDCLAVLEGKVDGVFYILEVERNSIWGGGSWVRFDRDKDGLEITALNFPKGLSKKEDLTIRVNSLALEKNWQAVVYESEDKDAFHICQHDQQPGTWGYNLIEISQQVLLDGQACPIKKDAKTSVVPKPPQPLPPAIYQFPEMLPCDRLSWMAKMNDPSGGFAFQVWFDFTPKGPCKPSEPKN
ncbi:uncharacterized protein LOC135161280 [Diachasmimorpha longicaudata]|uniref:uncharacterized protein LOC135161280 n=1 Tax=Diachasmimorpha longicaudata TaxID=58733 RepID=UPI0030B9066A